MIIMMTEESGACYCFCIILFLLQYCLPIPRTLFRHKYSYCYFTWSVFNVNFVIVELQNNIQDSGNQCYTAHIMSISHIDKN